MFFANIVWPAIYLVDRLTLWYVIIPSVIIEAYFYGKAFADSSLKKGVVLAFFSNLATAVLGLCAITQISALLVTILRDELVGDGTFAPTGWVVNAIWCIGFNTVVEYYVVKLIAEKIMYRNDYFFPRKAWGRVFMANIITFALAMLLPALLGYRTLT